MNAGSRELSIEFILLCHFYFYKKIIHWYQHLSEHNTFFFSVAIGSPFKPMESYQYSGKTWRRRITMFNAVLWSAESLIVDFGCLHVILRAVFKGKWSTFRFCNWQYVFIFFFLCPFPSLAVERNNLMRLSQSIPFTPVPPRGECGNTSPSQICQVRWRHSRMFF